MGGEDRHAGCPAVGEPEGHPPPTWNTSLELSLMKPCLWELVQSCWGNANGAPCWQAFSSTSTRAAMKRHIARPIPWHHRTASRERRQLLKSVDRMPHAVGMEIEEQLQVSF